MHGGWSNGVFVNIECVFFMIRLESEELKMMRNCDMFEWENSVVAFSCMKKLS